MSGMLRRMYELVDGPDASACTHLLADGLAFSILFSTGPGEADDFAGGRAEFDAYMAQRGTPTWTHHVLAESITGALEVVFGETRQDGRALATFVAAARIDADGLIDRYVVGRSTAVLFELT
jgi:hypothetical protein